MINEAIEELIKNNDLDFNLAKEVYDEIFSGLSNEIQASSFFTALASKKPSTDEIKAGIICARDSVKKINLGFSNESKIENISLVEDENYIDFTLANDLICAANGLIPLRFCVDLHNYSSRSFEILSLMGVKFKQPEFDFYNEIENINLCYIYLSNHEAFFKYTQNLKKNLNFPNSACVNLLNLFEKMLNPYNSKNLFLGIKTPEKVEEFAKLALELNYENSIIVSGFDKTPFLSIENETNVAEAWKNKIFAYKFSPEFVDFKKAPLDEIKVENNQHCAEILLNIIENKIQGSIFDSIVLNSGFALYISKKAPSLIEGIDLAADTIKSGRLKEKFEQIKNFYN